MAVKCSSQENGARKYKYFNSSYVTDSCFTWPEGRWRRITDRKIYFDLLYHVIAHIFTNIVVAKPEHSNNNITVNEYTSSNGQQNLPKLRSVF